MIIFGNLIVKVDEKSIFNLKIFAENDIRKKEVFDYFRELVGELFKVPIVSF